MSSSGSSSPSKKRGLPLRVKMRHDQHFVDEIAARHETPVGRMLPLSSIEPDPGQPRSTMGELDDLVASIRDKGVLEPLLVRPDEEQAGKFRIVSGERRYRAASAAGLFEVPVIEMDVTAEEALEIALIENLQRRDLTPFEEAEGYRTLAERFDYTHEQIATVVGKTRTVITESLALLKLPSRVREAAQALGITSKSLLREVGRLEEEGEMLALLERVAEGALTRDDLRLEGRRRGGRKAAARPARRPYTFKFRAPDERYSLSLSFRQREVDKQDLIRALEEILEELKRAPEPDETGGRSRKKG